MKDIKYDDTGCAEHSRVTYELKKPRFAKKGLPGSTAESPSYVEEMTYFF
jgi:hypothetical protein